MLCDCDTAASAYAALPRDSTGSPSHQRRVASFLEERRFGSTALKVLNCRGSLPRSGGVNLLGGERNILRG